MMIVSGLVAAGAERARPGASLLDAFTVTFPGASIDASPR